MVAYCFKNGLQSTEGATNICAHSKGLRLAIIKSRHGWVLVYIGFNIHNNDQINQRPLINTLLQRARLVVAKGVVDPPHASGV